MLLYLNILRKPLLRFKSLVEKTLGVSILFVSRNHRPLAVYSELGFWYAGDFFRTDDISYGILKNGVIEESETALVEKYLDSKTVFYDIGANTGYYGILAAARGGYSYFFEPVAENVKILQQSIFINQFESKTSIAPIALSDSVGEIEITLSGTGSSVVSAFLNDASLPKRIIKKDTLDNLVSKGMKPPTFIKIDVEGHELSVLRGGEKTIKKYSPVLFVELTASMKQRNFINSDYQITLDLLSSWGYDVYRAKEGKLVSQFEKEDGIYMYLCVPKKK